ncbi:MAG: SDR family NAD(P)-dependent oxidoreductase [Peptoniphilaceae bacterium]|nr:SDR family NAD(P)-dependent oxidoreductase [Peptoniphilaceae bacterium]
MDQFSGKVALVTGAGNGFGKAFALEAARRGMKVALLDIDQADIEGVKVLLRQQGVNDVMTVATDLSIYENVKKAVGLVMEKYGQIDVLFNNPGVCPLGDIVHMPARDFDWGISINLNAHAYMLMEVLPIMIKQKTPAHIMEVSSIAGILHGGATGTTYAATKHASLALAEDVRAYLKRNHIDTIGVSVFCPGFIQTDLHHYERHRPERFQNEKDPFYHSEMNQKLQNFLSVSIQTGIPLDGIAFRLFKAIEQNQMYVLTHPKFLEKIQMRHHGIEKDFETAEHRNITVDYKGKVALVTGAAHGFGKVFAEEAAAQGMKLALVDIDKTALEEIAENLKKSGTEVLAIHSDASVYEEVVESVKKVKETYGQIDVLFNNAGVATSQDLVHLHHQDWDWVIGVNLVGQTYYMKEVLPIMIAQKTKANIITTSSIAGLIPGFGLNPSYSASKHGTVAVTECVKQYLELAGIDYIKVALFCPAFIQTNLHHSESYRPARFAIANDPEHYASEDYKDSQRRLEHNITTGIPIDNVAKRLFASMEGEETYIITHPETLSAVQTRHRAIEDACKSELTLWDVYALMD